MSVGSTHARVLRSAIPVARSNRSVTIKTIFGDIAIPSCIHLADKDYFIAFSVESDPAIVTNIVSGFERGGCWRCAAVSNSSIRSGNVGTVCLKHSFLPLPISEWPTNVPVIVHIQNRSVHSLQYHLALVLHILQLDA